MTVETRMSSAAGERVFPLFWWWWTKD